MTIVGDFPNTQENINIEYVQENCWEYAQKTCEENERIEEFRCGVYLFRRVRVQINRCDKCGLRNKLLFLLQEREETIIYTCKINYDEISMK